MIEYADFYDVGVWSPYATAPQFTLSSGTGPKTVYFKVQNDFGASAVSNSTIIRN